MGTPNKSFKSNKEALKEKEKIIESKVLALKDKKTAGEHACH